MLTVARKTDNCRVLGPGKRAVVWFHGCTRSCPGCIARSMNESQDYETSSAIELYNWIKTCKDIEGVSLSGGDPLQQNIFELIEFCHLIKSDPRNLSIILFTGYTMEEIKNSELSQILPYLDIVVDGTYDENLNDDKGLRGSSNQVIHFLSDRYDSIKESFYSKENRNIEVNLSLNNEITINGIPKRGSIEQFIDKIKKQGIEINLY